MEIIKSKISIIIIIVILINEMTNKHNYFWIWKNLQVSTIAKLTLINIQLYRDRQQNSWIHIDYIQIKIEVLETCNSKIILRLILQEEMIS